MTSRERLLAAMSHEKPDRTPAVIAIRGEAQRSLMGHFGVKTFDEVRLILGIEEYHEITFEIEFPGFREKINGRLEGDFPFAGSEVFFHDERTFEDGWGILRRIGADRRYVEWVAGPLEDAGDPDEYQFPSSDWIAGDPSLPEQILQIKSQDLLVRCLIGNPYKIAWYLRGMENLLADYLINRLFVEKLYDRLYELQTGILVRATEAGVDMIGIEGDIAMQDRVIMGPDVWRSIDKPRLAGLIETCRRVNPEVLFFMHTDGDISELFPDLIEIGVDVIDSVQPECMDPFDLKQRYGKDIVLHGCGSLQDVLPYGTVEDCRREVTELVRRCGFDGGLVLRPSNMVGWDVPIENIVAWYETARDLSL